MCGRFSRDLTLAELAFIKRGEISEALLDAPEWRPTWNAAPTQVHGTVTVGEHGRELRAMRWGWRRSFTKALLVNAIGEEAPDKRTWRDAFLGRRCLVPATGFYEWTPKAITGAALPWAFARRDRKPFGIAGLWERAEVEGGTEDRFVLLTTAANVVVGKVHHRMAAILPPEAEEAWLSPDTPVEAVRDLLRPLPAEAMEAWRVSPAANNVRNNHPGLLEPVTA